VIGEYKKARQEKKPAKNFRKMRSINSSSRAMPSSIPEHPQSHLYRSMEKIPDSIGTRGQRAELWFSAIWEIAPAPASDSHGTPQLVKKILRRVPSERAR